MKVLAHEIAETCFLIEVLLYRAVGRLPLKSTPEEDETDALPEYPDIVLTPEECRVGGLESDSEWEESQSGEGDRLRTATLWGHPESDKQWIEWKAVKDWRQKEWNDKLKRLLARHHREFLAALLDGRLGSEGQRSGQLTQKDIAEGARWWDVPWEPIPSPFWSSCEIDWEKCRAKGETAGYESILVKTDDLLRVFPLPALEDAPGVRRIGNYLVASEEYADPRPRGRPPFPWDEFHLEVARRLMNGTLGKSQKTFEGQMQDWCESRWGRTPKVSTLRQKISPYYIEFIRSEKVRK
jgi:hypothetical protein